MSSDKQRAGSAHWSGGVHRLTWAYGYALERIRPTRECSSADIFIPKANHARLAGNRKGLSVCARFSCVPSLCYWVEGLGQPTSWASFDGLVLLGVAPGDVRVEPAVIPWWSDSAPVSLVRGKRTDAVLLTKFGTLRSESAAISQPPSSSVDRADVRKAEGRGIKYQLGPYCLSFLFLFFFSSTHSMARVRVQNNNYFRKMKNVNNYN